MTERKILSQDVQIKQLTVETSYVVGKTHIYTAVINGAQVLFDTGPPTEEGKNFLRRNVDLQNLNYVFITHWHPEHCGLADFLATETDATVFLAEAEVRKFNVSVSKTRDLFTQLGFPADESETFGDLLEKSQKVSPLPHRYSLLEDSAEQLAELGIRCLNCSWHSQSDVVYLLNDYAVIGDVALDGIFSAPLLDVDLEFDDGRRFNNYSAFCDAVTTLSSIDDRVFLPGHRQRLESVKVWLEFFLTKILQRARTIVPYLNTGKSVYEVVHELFPGQLHGKRFLTYLKTSEIVFIRDLLMNPERLLDTLSLNRLCPELAAELGKVDPLATLN
jgi:glyoxylase-like metal-dependent hydrolase (beta-lactamase superfamily II)